MAADELVQRLGEAVGRRKFLAKLGAASIGAAFMVVGLPDPAAATVRVRCCNLCRSPSSSCCGGSIYCVWSWTCCYTATRVRYRCSEYYCGGSGDCDADCTGVDCSRIVSVDRC